MVDLTINKIKYGGLYHYFFWDPKFNSLATVENCLANCTCFVLGDCGVTGSPRPVSTAVGAARWHEYVANGWKAIPFDPSKIKVGDIIEWTENAHVARIFKIENGVPWVRASFYTGEHGVSVYDGHYDTRTSFSTTEQVSDFMVKNYPARFYHENTLDKENKMVNCQPAYILSMPNTINPVERNEDVNQIRTTDDTLRIRTSPSLDGSIVGHVEIGYYNVLSIEKSTTEDRKWYKDNRGEDLTCWYEIAKDRWCGNVTTEYLPKKGDSDVAEAMKVILEALDSLQEENDKLKEGIRQISDIVNKLI